MLMMFLRLAIVALVAAAANWYYGLILPAGAALVFAVLIGGAALFALVASQLKFSMALAGGVVIFTWPAGALAASAALEAIGAAPDRYLAIAAAWPLPLLAAKASFALAEKRDRARDLGGLALGVIAVYTVAAAAISGSSLALGLASLGAGAIALNAAHSLILPPPQEQFLKISAAGAALAAGANFLKHLFF